jgi:pyruvate dehydrogenase phosphatase
VGSCALTAVVLKDSLHIANAGDCEGVLLSEKEAAMTNLRLNAGEKFEQARLYKKFPGEEDIVRCRSACYVKGRLQPTRSFGDFYLKHKEYNFTKLAVFTGPYIEAAPLLTHFALTDKHANLILATDGLWDELNET